MVEGEDFDHGEKYQWEYNTGKSLSTDNTEGNEGVRKKEGHQGGRQAKKGTLGFSGARRRRATIHPFQGGDM